MINSFYQSYISGFLDDYLNDKISIEKIAHEGDCDVKMVIRVLNYTLSNNKTYRSVLKYQKEYNYGELSSIEISNKLKLKELLVIKVLEPKLILFNQRNFEKIEKMNDNSKPIIKPRDLTVGDYWQNMNWKQRKEYETKKP